MEQLLTIPDVAEGLQISTSELYKLCEERRIPFRRIGRGRGRIRFTSEDVATIIEAALVAPNERQEVMSLD